MPQDPITFRNVVATPQQEFHRHSAERYARRHFNRNLVRQREDAIGRHDPHFGVTAGKQRVGDASTALETRHPRTDRFDNARAFYTRDDGSGCT
jgi:hypothetical protein